MLKPRVKARRATKEVATATVHPELMLAYASVVAVEEQEVAGLEADALAQGKAHSLGIGRERTVRRSGAKGLDCSATWLKV